MIFSKQKLNTHVDKLSMSQVKNMNTFCIYYFPGCHLKRNSLYLQARMEQTQYNLFLFHIAEINLCLMYFSVIMAVSVALAPLRREIFKSNKFRARDPVTSH